MGAENPGTRRTGRAYRRKMSRKHEKYRRWIISLSRYCPRVGYFEWGHVDGVWQQTGNHIKFPGSSNAQRYLKRCSNRAVRRRREAFRGNQYRKCFEYQWSLY